MQKLGWRARGEFVLAGWVKAWSRWFPSALPNYQPAVVCTVAFGPCAQAQRQPLPQSSIPRIIWAYWNGATLPLVVARCIDGWRKLHPQWRVEVLNDETALQHIHAWPAALARVSVQQRSDWLRLELLRLHGGIWVDASTILTESLDWVLQQQARTGSDFVGFYLQRFTHLPQYPIVENWFMAVPPATALVADIQAEFTQQVLEKSALHYVDQLQQLGVYESVVQGIDSPLYLSMHLAIQRVLQRADANYRLDLLQAEESAFLLHEQAGWNRAGLKRRLFFMPVQGRVPPLIKLRGPDRKKLDEYLTRGLYGADSLAAHYLVDQGALNRAKEQ
ncbi:mannosyltransferase [Lampropedia puyangensis]|uniref:Mannosyltransferase n=1 Tax=Lampropedia puyangensis TaxID=1330072 RepID=A0A4V4GRE7_9BURK|nr:mannosyltransferase [Lampropedia puyangensis]